MINEFMLAKCLGQCSALSKDQLLANRNEHSKGMWNRGDEKEPRANRE